MNSQFPAPTGWQCVLGTEEHVLICVAALVRWTSMCHDPTDRMHGATKKNEDLVVPPWRQLRIWILVMVFLSCGNSEGVGNLWLLWMRIYNKFSFKDRKLQLWVTHLTFSQLTFLWPKHNLIHRESGTMSYHHSHRLICGYMQEFPWFLFRLGPGYWVQQCAKEWRCWRQDAVFVFVNSNVSPPPPPAFFFIEEEVTNNEEGNGDSAAAADTYT